MVGVAVALIVVASAATLLAGNLREQRTMLLEARLMQDLRTATDIVARDLRRAGYWGAVNGPVQPGSGATHLNPYAALAPIAAASDAASFRYSRDDIENNLVDSNEQFGFRLRTQAVEVQLGAGNWQSLTDRGTLSVTRFSITPVIRDIGLAPSCAQPCRAGSTACPPRQQVRQLTVVIAARLVADASVTRSVHSQVRVRNDAVTGTCEG